MPPDNSFQNALFSMVQRIEDKIDILNTDITVLKSEQSSIKTELQDHIENSKEPQKSGLEAAQSICQKYIIPLAIALLLIGRYSVSYVGNSNLIKAPVTQTSTKIYTDDTFIARNKRTDSLLRTILKKQVGLE